MATSSSTQNQKYGSTTSTSGGSTSSTSSHKEGGSSSTTQGYSDTTASAQGGSTSTSAGKTYASGQVSDTTQQKFNQYNNDYVQSDNVANAYNNLQAAINNKPAFQSTYADKLSNMYDQIMNRDKFNYNFNEDAMYQMYKDQYSQMGQQAMQDTMGQAAALTGGYGSSYAQTAGQQQYQNYLQQLNNMIPELRNQAYQEYVQEGQDLLNKYNITNDAYNNEYGQYRDSVADWQSDRSFDYGMYSDERNFDYNKYQGDRNYWAQEYWNEKNAEQSNMQAAQENNWQNSQSHTNNFSQTNTNYWENGTSNTNTSNWGTQNVSGWQDTNSNTMSTPSGSGSGSSASKAGTTDATHTYNRSESLDAYSAAKREQDISQLATYIRNDDQKNLKSALKDMLEKGTGTGKNKVVYSEQDIANLYNRAMEWANKDNNNNVYYTPVMRESDVINWLYSKEKK